MNNINTPDPMESTAIGMTAESTHELENENAMSLMQDAFQKIEKLKQGETLDEEKGEQAEEEPEPDPVEEPASEDVTPSAEEPPADDKKTKKLSAWDMYKHEKYRLLEEKERLAQENQRLKEQLEESVYNGTYHYGKSAYAELDKAIDAKKRAFEESDTDAMIKADVALIKAQRGVDDLESWMDAEKRKEPRPSETPSTTGQPTYSLSAPQAAMIQDWFQEHPDLNPSSASYVKDKALKVIDFVNYIDGYIAQNNLQHTLMSPDYFQAIDDFIHDMEQPKKKTQPSTPPPSVAAVKNAYGQSGMNGNSRPKVRVTLTADEKRMARNMGVSEEEWAKYKSEEMK
jgi:hypothetical protein